MFFIKREAIGNRVHPPCSAMAKKPSVEKELAYSNISYGKPQFHTSKFEIRTLFQPIGHQTATTEQLVSTYGDIPPVALPNAADG